MLIPDTKPRWPGGPPICDLANLPAFDSEPALAAWMGKFTPGVKILKVFTCGTHWHAETTPREPSGDSSGHGRYEKHKQQSKKP